MSTRILHQDLMVMLGAVYQEAGEVHRKSDTVHYLWISWSSEYFCFVLFCFFEAESRSVTQAGML